MTDSRNWKVGDRIRATTDRWSTVMPMDFESSVVGPYFESGKQIGWRTMDNDGEPSGASFEILDANTELVE